MDKVRTHTHRPDLMHTHAQTGPHCTHNTSTLTLQITVNGPDAHPAWTLAKEAFPGDIAWNFAGIFLFDGAGECKGRFDAKQLKEADAALAELAAN